MRLGMKTFHAAVLTGLSVLTVAGSSAHAEGGLLSRWRSKDCCPPPPCAAPGQAPTQPAPPGTETPRTETPPATAPDFAQERGLALGSETFAFAMQGDQLGIPAIGFGQPGN